MLHVPCTKNEAPCRPLLTSSTNTEPTAAARKRLLQAQAKFLRQAGRIRELRKDRLMLSHQPFGKPAISQPSPCSMGLKVIQWQKGSFWVVSISGFLEIPISDCGE
jgi:hypothetical protein